jgi:Ca2+-binding RTX toxin-like protein
MRLVAFCIFLSVLALNSASAQAASVRVTSGHLRYSAGNESNRLKVTTDPAGAIAFDDRAARITAGTGCRSTGRNTAVCSGSPGAITRITISGSGGNDVLEAPFMAVPLTLDGAGGNDTLTGGGAADTLDGDDGNDRLVGLGGNDRLQGDGGTDTLIGGPGADVLSGDAGTDTADYSAATGAVLIDLDGQSDDGQAQEKDRVESDVERVIGGPFDDRLVAISGTHTLDGGAGNDILEGGSGVDTLLGRDGNDVINGNVAGDKIDGAAGVDTADYAGRFDPVDLDLTAGTAVTFRGSGSRRVREQDQLLSMENVRGTRHADTLRGGPGPNLILGGPGNDILDGRFGADVLNGGAGRDGVDYSARRAPVFVELDDVADDGNRGEKDFVDVSVEDIAGGAAGDEITGSARRNRLFGGGGRDKLFGLSGGDLLDGGPGADVPLDGGDGRDKIVGGTGLDLLVGGANNDIFEARDGQRDRVECNEGIDRVDTSDRKDAIEDDCERTPGR